VRFPLFRRATATESWLAVSLTAVMGGFAWLLIQPSESRRAASVIVAGLTCLFLLGLALGLKALFRRRP
jgi:hypothetical protein